jgi:hypothetical protein
MSAESPSSEATADDCEESQQTGLARVDAELAALREDDTRRRVASVGAVVVGLGLVLVHWVGLFVAGALVGLTRQTLPRALLAGAGFGLLVLGLFFVVTPLVTPWNLAVLAPLSYLTVALALVGPTWGALLRGAL